MLIELEKLSREVGLPETEVRNLAVYNGLRRQPGGGYDEAALLKNARSPFARKIIRVRGA